MAADITNALASGQLSATEVAQLQGVLAGLTGDAELAARQSVNGESEHSSAIKKGAPVGTP